MVVAGLFGLWAWRAGQGSAPELPAGFKTACNAVLGPVSLSVGSFVLLAVSYRARRWLVTPAVAWLVLNASLAWLGLSLADVNFAAIAARPDNVPIVAMVYLLGFFIWLGTYQGVKNDERLARGQPVVESRYADTVLVWPDVIYLELIGAIIASVVLIVWSLWLRAPLESPADPAVTPNPAKAPWYFLGLQELLVYFPPWIAGVVLPGLMIVGLMAIPYLDLSPRGSGYYSIRQRRGAYLIFLFGFLQLWVLPILIGTFFRGPNWSFFGLYEPHDPHKLILAKNITLSEYFWVLGLGKGLPQVPPGCGAGGQFLHLLWREAPGILVSVAYMLGLPIALRYTWLKQVRQHVGRGRFAVLMFLLLAMLAVPLKMILVWTLHLSYLINMPEYFFYL